MKQTERIADALLMRVYHRVSAVISMGSGGQVLRVKMFDTEFAGEHMRIDPRAERIILLSCHPEGFMELYDADLANAAALRAAAPQAELDVYLVNEDMGCRRMALPCDSCYNECHAVKG